MNFLFLFAPACLNCKFYQSYLPQRNYDDLGKCTKLNTTMYAEMTRYDEKKCGVDGKWFVSK
jgi:hypothetical protein